MKIIQPGKIPEPRPERCTCDHCGCVFEFEKHEAVGGIVRCPTCRHVIWVREAPGKKRRRRVNPWGPDIIWQAKRSNVLQRMTDVCLAKRHATSVPDVR